MPFLGELAFFPQGPYILASLLKCPVYIGFAIHKGRDYILSIQDYATQVILTRKNREEQIYEYIKNMYKYYKSIV